MFSLFSPSSSGSAHFFLGLSAGIALRDGVVVGDTYISRNGICILALALFSLGKLVGWLRKHNNALSRAQIFQTLQASSHAQVQQAFLEKNEIDVPKAILACEGMAFQSILANVADHKQLVQVKAECAAARGEADKANAELKIAVAKAQSNKKALAETTRSLAKASQEFIELREELETLCLGPYAVNGLQTETTRPDRQPELHHNIEPSHRAPQAASSSFPFKKHAASSSNGVSVVVSGRQFFLDAVLESNIVAQYPESALGALLRNCDQLDMSAPFEGPDPRVFNSVLAFLRNGKWKIPKGISIARFREEVGFWMLPCPSTPFEFEFEDVASTLCWTSSHGWVVTEETRKRRSLEEDLLHQQAQLFRDLKASLDNDNDNCQTPDDLLKKHMAFARDLFLDRQKSLFGVSIALFALKPFFEELVWRMAMGGKADVTFTLSDSPPAGTDDTTLAKVWFQFVKFAKSSVQALEPIFAPLVKEIVCDTRVQFRYTLAFASSEPDPLVAASQYAFPTTSITAVDVRLRTIQLKVISPGLSPGESTHQFSLPLPPVLWDVDSMPSLEFTGETEAEQ